MLLEDRHDGIISIVGRILYLGHAVEIRPFRQYPPPKETSVGGGASILKILPEEIGRPVTEGLVSLAKAFRPKHLQVVPHDAYVNGQWTLGTLTIRVDADGYTAEQITIALEVPDENARSNARRIEGTLDGYFETGTEGLIWSVEDDNRPGIDRPEPICEGDQLTVLDGRGEVAWKGIIRCDRKVGWQGYPRNRKYGQQCALGYWVHWIQEGFKPDDWARYFVRPVYDRFRGILIKKPEGKRNPRLGPDPVEACIDRPCPPNVHDEKMKA